MSKAITLYALVFLVLSRSAVSLAAADEQCVVRYDKRNNVYRIPCVEINGQRLWANLRATPEQGKLEVAAVGDSFLPAWVIQLIAQTENAPVENPPKVITQHNYNGAVVYEVSSPCCDQYNYLYDASGKTICAPSGGFTGRGDGRCTDFAEKKTNSVVIWQDTR
jgi:hypothetical protein